MKLRVFSEQMLTEYLAKGMYNRLAVISFYEPDEEPMPLPDHIQKYYVQAYDNDRDALKLKGIRYGKYLPEADSLAEFIFGAYRENCEIICQCSCGQSISAGCAAAIAEYFENDGISIFSDYRFCPNQTVYHKVYNALRRTGGSEPEDGKKAYIFSRSYDELFMEKYSAAEGDNEKLLDFLSDAEDIIADKYGSDSIFIADILYDRGAILWKMRQYEKAAATLERAEKIYLEKDRKNGAYHAVEMLAKTLLSCGKCSEAVFAARRAVSYNKWEAGFLLAFIYKHIKEYHLAQNVLQQLCNSAEAPRKRARALRETGRIYYSMGEKKAAAAYLTEAYSICCELYEECRSHHTIPIEPQASYKNFI